MANKLKKITTVAKQLYKTGKFTKWTDAIKAASKKIAGTGTHKDTKSHNVNIRVVSGVKRLSKAKKDYNADVKNYKYFIFADGKIQSGWEFKSDAMEAATDYEPKAKIYTLQQLKKLGIENPINQWLYKVGSVKKKAVSGWSKGNTALREVNEKKIEGKKNVRVYRAPKNSMIKPGTFYKFSALGSFFDTSIINDIDALKKEYFKKAKIYHPDAGGTTAQFQQLQSEYEKLLKKLLAGGKLNTEQQENEIAIDEAMREVINQIIVLPGINIELVGKWLWISGNTYPIKTELKKAGLIFIKKAGVPYWVYKGVESAGRGKLSIEEIKAKYGVQKFNPKENKFISGVRVSSKTKLLAALRKLTKGLNKRPV